MKSILYVGATLMIGASIYGFVDYQQTSHKKEFSNMYKEKEVTEPVKTVDEPAVVAEKKEIAAKEKEVTAVVEKKETKKAVVKKKKRKLDSRLFSRGALDERYIKEEVKLELPKEKTESKTESVKSENKEQ